MLCKECNVKFDPALLAYSATVDGEFFGICQFTMSDKGGAVYDIAPSKKGFNFEALFVLGRAALNFIDLCGVHYARYLGEIPDEQTKRLVSAVGFKEGENGLEVDLNGFFTDHCHDKK